MDNFRKDIIGWTSLFMNFASLAAKRSKDPSTQVGACIVDPRMPKIISTGYNGFPSKLDEKAFSWSSENDDFYKTKYAVMVHAELNAIILAKQDVSRCFLFTTLFPCNECAKAIIQAGIKRIYFMSRRDIKDKENEFFTLNLFQKAGVQVKSFNPKKLILNEN
ncbi:dCMP deaminase family protein [Spiroplasma endosymbiont of Amphibalanus improvisus]|uniref:deoxycytidylate deaminase n=1 Tax=Spiroplasma endosymbiont of Amphibalanus improvisus TaxID=3066327 RepID=UPI00313E8AD9